jgi:hypothetical protein
MFQIPVSDLLGSYSGDSKSFSFSGEIYDGYIPDVKFVSPLEFSVTIIALDDGVDVLFDSLTTTVVYEERKHTVSIGHFERTYKTHVEALDPDDIRPIADNMIDLTPVLREEIIMATYST